METEACSQSDTAVNFAVCHTHRKSAVVALQPLGCVPGSDECEGTLVRVSCVLLSEWRGCEAAGV
jgi:hypothetical protein